MLSTAICHLMLLTYTHRKFHVTSRIGPLITRVLEHLSRRHTPFSPRTFSIRMTPTVGNRLKKVHGNRKHQHE